MMRNTILGLAVCAGLLSLVAGPLVGQTTLTQSSDPNTVAVGNTVACGNVFGQTENSYFRAYTVASAFTPVAVRFGVEVDESAPTTISLRFWNCTVGASTLTLGTQIGTTTSFTTPANGTWNGTTQTIFINAPTSIPAGTFAVEVMQSINSGELGNFFFGSNTSGESGPGYLRAVTCGVNVPTTLDSLAFATVDMIIDVVGYASPATAPNPEIDVRFPASPRHTVASGATVNVGPLNPGALNNVSLQIANQGTSTALTISSAVASAPSGCTVGAITPPASTAAGAQANLVLPITPSAGVGTFSFTLTINNNDANEGTYTLTIQGTRGMTGTYNVGTGQTYTNPGAAFDDLEAFGLAGPVTLSIASGTYVPTGSYGLGIDSISNPLPVRGLSATNTLLIQSATVGGAVMDGAAFIDPVGAAETGCMSIHGLSYVTVDGLSFTNGGGFGLWIGHDSITTGRQTNLTVRNCRFSNMAFGPGLAIVNNIDPLDNILVENCMFWNCVGGESAYGSLFMGSIAIFYCGANTVIQHCSILNNAGFTSVANVGQPGCISFTGGAEAVRAGAPGATPPQPVRKPTVRFNALVADGANRPCYYVPADDPTQTTAGPFGPESANRNVLYTVNGGLVGTAGLTGQPTLLYTTLANWQTGHSGFGYDANSVTTNPNFISATDLHINTGSSAIDLATGSTVTTDIDGDARTTPDAGADEFTGAVPVTPAVTVVATDPSAAEATPATATGAYTVTLSAAAASAVTVNFTMSGTAAVASGTDYNLSATGATLAYVAGPTGTLTFAAGITSAVVTLTPVDDAAVESAETAILTINTGTGYTVGTPADATVTIADNDTVGTPVVTVSTTTNAGEPATNGTFTLTASPAPASTITVNLTLGGTATGGGTDYNASATTTVQITTSGSATVTITVVDDLLVEGTETVTITLAAGTGYTVGTPGNASMNITDDDTGGTPVVTVATTTNAGEPATNGTFTLTASPAPASTITVNLTLGGTATGGGTDYNASATTSVQITTSGSVTVTITVVNDLLVEGTETVTITLAAGTGYTVGTPGNASMNITDDDTAGSPLNITTTSLANGTVGTAYPGTVSCTGGTGPYTWSIASGTLPTGLALGSSTTTTVGFTGTPSVANTFNFTIQVSDSTAGTPQTDTQPLSITIAAGGGGGGGGVGGGGGGGGGGGCAADTGSTWLALLGMFALMALAYRKRRTA